MAVAGVIAEYNPFHRGHAWQLSAIRERLGEDTAVVVAMSGNFVQRGDFALLNKHARAEMALRGGADLVLELPTAWAAATAERFAQGGVAILAAAGVVTHLAFGCESGALGPLAQTAGCLDSPAYPEVLRRHLGGGMTFAAARQRAAEELAGAGASCLASPNNALAVEYLRALNAMKSEIRPLALPRVGAAHDSGEEHAFSSASAIRAKLLAGESWRALVPETTAEVIDREIATGRAPAAMSACERAVLARLRTMGEEDFRPYDGGNEGLYHRFYDAVHRETTVDAILEAVKTRRYPLARLRRMLLSSYLGLTPAAAGETPAYLRVLGATARGRGLLAEMREAAALPVLTKAADARRLGERVRTAFEREVRCTDLYTLACPDLAWARPGSEYTQNPVML